MNKQRKIVFLCDLGISTSLFLGAMEAYIEAHELDFELCIGSVSEVYNVCKFADIVLLGPQVRHNYKMITKILPGVVVEMVSKEDFESKNIEGIMKTLK